MSAKTTFPIILFLFALTVVKGQDYQTSLGLRIGAYPGLTIKHFLNSNRALEGILLTRKGGASITGLYEIHTPAFKAERLQAYGGIGGHINFFERHNGRYWRWDKDDRYDDESGINIGDETYIAIGVDMILGLEYTFVDLPFNLGVDWKPALNIIGDFGLSTNQFAISFRFVF